MVLHCNKDEKISLPLDPAEEIYETNKLLNCDMNEKTPTKLDDAKKKVPITTKKLEITIKSEQPLTYNPPAKVVTTVNEGKVSKKLVIDIDDVVPNETSKESCVQIQPSSNEKGFEIEIKDGAKHAEDDPTSRDEWIGCCCSYAGATTHDVATMLLW